jgi:hypothetical protein
MRETKQARRPRKDKIMKIEIGYSPKTIKIDNEEFLHFWYSNNAGRGKDNCSVIRSTNLRAPTSAKQTGIIASTKTSAWSGNVNFTAKVRKELGL